MTTSRHSMSGHSTLAGSKIRASNPLVGIRSLLRSRLLTAMRRLAGAAACADEPEEARGNGEGDAEPDDGEHLVGDGSFDVEGLEDGFESADEHSVDACRGCGCGYHEERLYLERLLDM